MTALPAYRTVSVRRSEFPAGRRVLILSDIHGHAEALRKVLRRAAFSPEDTLAWLRTIHAVYERYAIARCVWNYKELDFGLSDARLDGVREELLTLL